MRVLIPCAEAIFFSLNLYFPPKTPTLPSCDYNPRSGCSKPGGVIDPHTDVQVRRVGTILKISSSCYLQTTLLTDLVHTVRYDFSGLLNVFITSVIKGLINDFLNVIVI